MASNSDDDSSDFGAPENFHITNENDDGSHWSVGSVKCPLCNYLRKAFHCRFCIRDGNFIHSSHHLAERFAEKQLKYKNLKSVHRTQQATCEKLLIPYRLGEDLQVEIKRKRENILILKKLIDERSSNLKKLKEKRDKLTTLNKYTKKQLPQYMTKCQNLADYIERGDERNVELKKQCMALRQELKDRIRLNIDRLMQFVFPLTQKISKGDSVQAIESGYDGIADTVTALAEATHTAYIRGRWILQDSESELQHVIVAPSLPGNGDYSAYNDWVATTNKGGVANLPETAETLISTNCAYRISAALTYTAQLTYLLSFFLDVSLPYKLNYSDFCKKELTEESFTRKVGRLNTNILYLCYTQRVKLHQLSPNHTLENITKLLSDKFSDLGRIGPVEVSDNFHGSANFKDLLYGVDSESEEDESSITNEWEAISHPHQPLELTYTPHLQNQPNLPNLPNLQNLQNLQHLQNPQQTASTTNGLVTSAVQSVASIWRVFTAGK